MTEEKRKNIRAVISYINSTKNEIEIDVWRYAALNIDPRNYGYLPRPTAWISKLGKYKVLLPILAFFWRIFFSFLFVIISYIRAITKYYFSNYNRHVPNRFATVAVAVAPRSIDVIHGLLGNANYNWLVAPWIDKTQIDDQNRVIDIYSLIHIKDLNRIFYLSFFSLRCSSKRIPRRWSLQLYTSFNWFLIYLALDKCSGDLITSEHYDRFAVLVDSVSQRRMASSKLTLIQHGIVTDPTNKQIDQSAFVPPTKLFFVKNLYVYDEQSKEYFMQNILNSKHSPIAINYFRPELRLSDIPFDNEPSVLFVGNSISISLHLYLLKELKKKFNFNAYYKPHPTEKIGNLITRAEWIVIQDRSFFPRVNFLITYPSTLINEYAHLNIKSFTHAINLSIGDSSEYQSLVERELKLFSEDY